MRKKIVEYFKNNVHQRQIAKALQISSSTVHNIIKRFRETREISVRKGQGRITLLDAYGLRALRLHCLTHRHDSVIDLLMALFHCMVRYGSARLGTVRLSSGRFAFPPQFSTAIEWAG